MKTEYRLQRRYFRKRFKIIRRLLIILMVLALVKDYWSLRLFIGNGLDQPADSAFADETI